MTDTQLDRMGQDHDGPRRTAQRLVERLGIEAARRTCRSNFWYGVLAELDRMGPVRS